MDGLIDELGLTTAPARFTPRFNIAPSQTVAVIDNRPRDQRAVTGMRWGLVPRWAKDPAIGYKMINARSESVAEKPAFRDALRRRRCLIPADGFYEWKATGKSKTPFYMRKLSHQPFAFAGLWERWKAPDGEVLHSCTIITTQANELLAPVHHRMPVIVAAEDYERWLEPSPLPPQAVDDILVTTPAAGFELYEVSRLVSSPKNETPACIAPAPKQGVLFT